MAFSMSFTVKLIPPAVLSTVSPDPFKPPFFLNLGNTSTISECMVGIRENNICKVVSIVLNI